MFDRVRVPGAPAPLVFLLATLVPAPLAAQEERPRGGAEVAAKGMAHEAHAERPASGIRAELLQDIDLLEEKYLSLAEAMTGRYDWRPGDGVRSVGEVFMHIAGSNFMIPTLAGISPPEEYPAASMQEAMARMEELERVSDEAEVKEHLRHGFAHARHAISSVPDEELDEPVQIFGRPGTRRLALVLLVTHMHEHLGQSVAYARMNGVVPPWSEGS